MTGKIFLPMNEYIAYSNDQADKIMQKIYGKDYDNFIVYSKTHPDISFTEEGQDIYNEIIDKVEEFLAPCIVDIMIRGFLFIISPFALILRM